MNPLNLINMKQITFLALVVLTLTFLGCSKEQLSNGAHENSIKDPNFRVVEISGNARTSYSEPCATTNLIAGQNHIAGVVEIDSDGVSLSITYITDPGWTIDATHLSIGDCGVQEIPTTGSGNPKIGHFEHSTTHNTGVNEVTYYIDLAALNNNYCFAAHAEVTGPNSQETAWAEGPSFDGNSWAMYVEAFLSDCDVDGHEPPTR